MAAADSTVIARAFDRKQLSQAADWLAVALAASLPWSTSATSIFAVLWLFAFLPTIDRAELQRTLMTAAGGLPVVLWMLGAVGMLWADAPFSERFEGFQSFFRLLFIPLLMIHFQRSERGVWVLAAFLGACVVLLVVSWALLLFPDWSGPKRRTPGIPVKEYISQSAMFIVAIAVTADRAIDAWLALRRNLAAAWGLLAVAFLANILFIATSRTALVVMPILFVLLGLRRFGWKGRLGLLIALVVLLAAAWPSSSFLRLRVTTLIDEIEIYQAEGRRTSAGERLELWKKSLAFISTAPFVGHGTGSIAAQFRQAADPRTEASAILADNPHNQTLTIAIQLGLLGVAALFAMWISHLLLFRGGGLVAWIGLAVVVQNIVGSLFNSHLFDFTQGWAYVIGVGIAGGLLLGNRERRGLWQSGRA